MTDTLERRVALVAEWVRLEQAFHDAVPSGQGETGDGGTAGRALCQFLYDHSETLRAAILATPSSSTDTLGEWASIDDAVGAAIAEHADWHSIALPSAPRCEPRVMVKDGDTLKLRRPFKSKGHWRVRWQGVARIVSPKRIDGNIVFLADWS